MARKQSEDLSYGIIGLGRFGSLAYTLAEAGKEIMVLDYGRKGPPDTRGHRFI